MKKTAIIPLLIGVVAVTLFTGCLELRLGGGSRTETINREQHPGAGPGTVAPTLGRQLIDLQNAREAGAISDQEYQEQRARLLQAGNANG